MNGRLRSFAVNRRFRPQAVSRDMRSKAVIESEWAPAFRPGAAHALICIRCKTVENSYMFLNVSKTPSHKWLNWRTSPWGYQYCLEVS